MNLKSLYDNAIGYHALLVAKEHLKKTQWDSQVVVDYLAIMIAEQFAQIKDTLKDGGRDNDGSYGALRVGDMLRLVNGSKEVEISVKGKTPQVKIIVYRDW